MKKVIPSPRYVLIISTFLLVLCSSLQASDDVEYSPRQIENIISCIQTGNEGVRKCAIYFAGKYKIEEVSDILVEILEKENDSSVILAASFALCQIDEERAIRTILNMAVKNPEANLSKVLVQTAVEFIKK